MIIDTAHTGLWSALGTFAAAAAALFVRIGAQWAQVLAKLDDIHQNQQVLADHVGVVLPRPFQQK